MHIPPIRPRNIIRHEMPINQRRRLGIRPHTQTVRPRYFRSPSQGLVDSSCLDQSHTVVVLGQTRCNRYTGSAATDDDVIEFGVEIGDGEKFFGEGVGPGGRVGRAVWRDGGS